MKKRVQRHDLDIISNLPTNVTEIILARMPIRDAVRTSILSKKWRFLWVNMPQLVFDDTMFQNKPFNKKDVFFNIYQILLLHHGPILEFTLSITQIESCSEIDQLLLFLSRNGLEKLFLHIWSGELFYKLPSSFFSFPHLTYLNLFYCEFEPRPKFKGFSRLISLEFKEVTFDPKAFGRFISSCPLIEELTLISCCEGVDTIPIIAPKLKFLCLRGIVIDVCLKNVPLLPTLTVAHIDGEEEPPDTDVEMTNIIELFGHLPVIENLYFGYNFIKSLIAGGIPPKLPSTLIHLRTLKLSTICFGELDEVSCALCLIRSAPNLQKLTVEEMYELIDADLNPVLKLLKTQDYSDIVLDQLREVKIQLVSGVEPELEFIKLLLARSPMLETMQIEPKLQSVDKRMKLLTKLTRFPRASAKAEIICEDPLPSQID